MNQKTSVLVRLVKSALYAHRLRKMLIPDKRGLFRTLCRTYLLSLKDRSRRITYVHGYKVSYADYSSFIYLLETLFFQREYAVNLDSAPSLILDCGSNIGMSILFFHKAFPEAKIVGFEPDPTAFQYLKTNIINNQLSDKVTIHSVALCDYQGTADFFVDPDVEGSLFMSSHSERLSMHKISVPCEKLSDYITEPVGLLKLDIEGSEMQVLRDLVDTKKINLVSHLLIEYHHHIRQEEDNISELFSLVEKLGFGYQIRAGIQPPMSRLEFQDILISAYCKRKI